MVRGAKLVKFSGWINKQMVNYRGRRREAGRTRCPYVCFFFFPFWFPLLGGGHVLLRRQSRVEDREVSGYKVACGFSL